MTRPRGAIFQALAASSAIHGAMFLAGNLAYFVKPLSFLAWVAKAIAAPPGFLIGRFIRPSAATPIAYVIAALEGFLFSLAFYALIAWAILRLWRPSGELRGKSPRRDS